MTSDRVRVVIDAWSQPGESNYSQRQHIMEVARRHIHRVGAERLTLVELAKLAKVARSTVYRYFTDKAELLRELVTLETAEFFAAMQGAMREHDLLDDQLARAAVFVRERRTAQEKALEPYILTADEQAVLVTRSTDLLRGAMDVIEPLLEEAKLRGEVPDDLETRRASEWIARMLISIALVRSESVDLHDMADVAAFFRRHARRGLMG